MDKEQRAEQKAKDDFSSAEKTANRRGMHGLEKWLFICGFLEEKLAQAYGQANEK